MEKYSNLQAKKVFFREEAYEGKSEKYFWDNKKMHNEQSTTRPIDAIV